MSRLICSCVIDLGGHSWLLSLSSMACATCGCVEQRLGVRVEGQSPTCNPEP